MDRKHKKYSILLKISIPLSTLALMLIPLEAYAVRGLTKVHAANIIQIAAEKGFNSNHQGVNQALQSAQKALDVHANIYSKETIGKASISALTQINDGLKEIPVARNGEKISPKASALLKSILIQLNTGQHQEAMSVGQQAHGAMRNLHVVFAANNENYLTAAGVSIFSIMQNASPHDFYNFYVYVTTEKAFTAGIPHEYENVFQELQDAFFAQCSIKLIPLDRINGAEGIDVLSWGLSGILRIILPEYLQNVDKVIYMDCDMIAMQDLRIVDDALRMDDPWSIAGVKDIEQEYCINGLIRNHAFHNLTDGEYINTGLLIMNLQKLRAENFTISVFEWMKNRYIQMPDQDAINVVWHKQIKVLDFNYAWPCLIEAMSNTGVVIFHYLDCAKPWYTSCHRPVYHVDAYNNYKMNSPFSMFPL